MVQKPINMSEIGSSIQWY